MKLRRTSRTDARVPDSSMSDIAFLLLIFFLVTTAFAATKGLEFRLPAPAADSDQRAPVNAVMIQVEGHGKYLINAQPADLPELTRRIQSIMEINPKTPVIISGTDTATYGDMMDVMDELKLADVKHISMPTREEMATW